MPSLGRHVLAELHGCSPDSLNDPALLERILVASARDAGATVVESTFNPFAPHGVSGVVVIHESHIAIHTWPEHGFAALDVFTCGEDLDPTSIAGTVSRQLGAEDCQMQLIERGKDFEGVSADRAGSSQGAYTRNIWFTDRQDDIALSLRHAGIVFSEASAYQKVEVADSTGYGKILILDDRVAFTERDEFVYHEMISHLPANIHPDPKRILIIGGGDGGACREFLKHTGVEEITVVEIDPTVTEAARMHFPSMSSALDAAKVTLVHGDGYAFAKSSGPDYDIVIVDGLESAGDTEFDSTFVREIRKCLKPGGLNVTQVMSPTVSQERFQTAHRTALDAFGHAAPYLAFLPTYSTGMLSFMISSSEPFSTDSLQRGSIPDLRYYNDPVHRAAFSLPAFISRLTGGT